VIQCLSTAFDGQKRGKQHNRYHKCEFGSQGTACKLNGP
jgi:hypothetical protein